MKKVSLSKRKRLSSGKKRKEKKYGKRKKLI